MHHQSRPRPQLRPRRRTPQWRVYLPPGVEDDVAGIICQALPAPVLAPLPPPKIENTPRGFEMRLVNAAARLPLSGISACAQGFTLVHISAQRKNLW